MIGLIRAEDAAGAVVAVNGHWLDVFDVHPDPDHGLVQLHGVASTGEQRVHVDAGALLPWLLDLPVIERRSVVMPDRTENRSA
jgi:hypothetical protein